MSTDWDVYCRNCKSEHGFSDANHEEDLMFHLIKHSSVIASMISLVNNPRYTITFRVYHGTIDPQWFADHLGHDLVVRSEYGDILEVPKEGGF